MSVDKTYSFEEVVQLLLKERERAVEIAYSFYNENKDKYETRKKAEIEVLGKEKLAFINREIADECRIIGNCISGLTGLSSALNETTEDLIRRNLLKE